MTKMRGKILSEKKEMYGSQEGLFKIQSIKTQRHQNANIGVVSFLRAVALMQKQSLQNQRPQHTISFVRSRLIAKFLWP